MSADHLNSPPLRILFLGPLRTMIGMDRHNLPCPIDRSQEALWSALRADFPKLRDHPLPIRLARNGEFLQAGESLAPGDEIALIPPVSGG